MFKASEVKKKRDRAEYSFWSYRRRKIFRGKFNDKISNKELIGKDFTVKVLIKEERKALETNPGDFLKKFEREKLFIKTLIHRILSNIYIDLKNFVRNS